ncbi:MAG: DUF1940 domain-containing protein [Candidatus Thermoplasmatota archaeon]|nr:DUF1940 domain-containing protein [Candidatus Thermoplasmatota archaeon]
MDSGSNNSEDVNKRFCDLLGDFIDNNSPYFQYDSSMKLAFSSFGLAISTGIRIDATRELLEMADKLYQNVSDTDTVLSDEHRKKLNHADDVWLDMKAKMSAGDIRASHLLAAHAHLSDALSYLTVMKNDENFREFISDYNMKYLSKLSVFVYREAIGHVML